MRPLFVMLAACALAGCAWTPLAPTTPYWDTHFGAAARLALAQQVIYPDAGRTVDAVAGIDGKAAQLGYERYRKSFSEPQQQPAFVINAK